MNIAEYLKKQMLYSIAFITIGLVALFTAYIFNFQKNLMLGISYGCIPTGVGWLLVCKFTPRNKKLTKNIILENEERNIFINHRAGHSAFWIVFLYILISLILSSTINISLHSFIIFTLFFMTAVYFLFVITYHNKY